MDALGDAPGRVATRESTNWSRVAFGVALGAYAAYQQFKLPPILPDFLARYPHSPVVAAGFMSVYALVGLGTVSIPSYVVKAEAYGGAKVKATIYGVKKSGTIDWLLAGDYGSVRSGHLKAGTNSLGTVTLATGSKKTYVYVGLDGGEWVYNTSLKVTYTYRVMTH